MSTIWRVLKYVLFIGAALLIAFISLGWYLTATNETARKNSPIIQKLDHAERSQQDVLALLFDGVKSVSGSEAELVVDWLLERQLQGDNPYLYLTGLYYGKQDSNLQRRKGAGYIAKAMLVYRVDAIKCGDPTATQAILIFEDALGLKAVRDGLKNKPELRKGIIETALEFEENTQERQKPTWVCRHGINQGNTPDAVRFEEHRQITRSEFERWF